jgi:hypothetical protein
LGAVDGGPLTLDKERASKFAQMALRCIAQEYPNKMDHVMDDAHAVLPPQTLHPAFYGCFDWHSSVHGHWLLVRLLKLFPNLPEAPAIRAALNHNLSAANLRGELAYLDRKESGGFERTYGWAWLLKLAEELHGWEDADGKIWLQNLTPLAEAFAKRYMEFLPKQVYAIRTGVHPNTAFGLAFALDYARTTNDKAMEELLVARAYHYYYNNTNCPANYEPGGEDFFSPCLMEAWLMLRILNQQDFTRWFHAFLPEIQDGKPKSLMEPAMVTDRTDGKLVHLDGLNLSRAWCMKQIAGALPQNDAAVPVLLKGAQQHATDALNNIHSGDYAGEHWLATFAVYLLTD